MHVSHTKAPRRKTLRRCALRGADERTRTSETAESDSCNGPTGLAQKRAHTGTCDDSVTRVNDKIATPSEYLGDTSAHEKNVLFMHSSETGTLPDDLQAVVEAWNELPEAIRAGITAMVKTATKRS